MPLSLKIISLALLFLEARIFFCLAAWRGHEMDVVVKRSSDCNGGECMWSEEMEMDSEINRRILAVQRRYISYASLKKDQVPCSRPGASYYNCRPVQAHPYTRGCSVITACARESRP